MAWNWTGRAGESRVPTPARRGQSKRTGNDSRPRNTRLSARRRGGRSSSKRKRGSCRTNHPGRAVLSDWPALDQGVPVKMALYHGVSLSFYFEDPEGHLIEVYWPTGVACRPRHGDAIDLTRPEEALRRDVAELVAHADAEG